MAERAQILIRAKDETAAAFSSVQSHFRGVSSTLGQVAPQLLAAFSVAGIVAFAKSAIDAGDRMNDLSQKTGLSVESLSKWKFIAEQSNTTLEGLVPGLKGLATNMDVAARASTETQNAFTRLGVPVKDGAGHLRQMDAVMLDLADRFSKMPDGAQKSALAVQIFGKAGQQLIPVLNQGTAGIAELMATAEKLGLVMDGEAAAAADELNDSLNLIKQAGTSLSTQLLNDMAPAISQVARRMAEAARDGGLFAAAIRGYAEAWKVLLFGVDQTQMQQQIEFIQELDKEIKQLQHDIPIQEKAGVLGRLSGGDPLEMKRRLDALILTINSARIALKLMQEQAQKPQEMPVVDVTGETDEFAKQRAKSREEIMAATYKRWQDKMKAHLAVVADLRKAEFDEAVSMGMELRALFDENEDHKRKIGMETGSQMRDLFETAMALEKTRLASLTESLKTENELRRFQFEEDVNLLHKSLADKLLAQETYDTLMARLTDQNAKRRTAIEDAEIKKRFGINTVYRKMDLNSAGFFFDQMGALMLTKSRTLFEIGKAGAIAGAIVDTYKAATGAYAALASIPFVGPALGVAAAAAAVAVGMARVQAIRATTMGSTGATGTFAANPSTGFPESPTSSGFEPPPSPIAPAQTDQVVRREINITLSGEGMFSADQIRDSLIPLLNDAIGDNVRLNVR
ncbi:MAG TPA: hypothetical protein VJT81_06550 [Burkholderiales bacterium]|nr:hypothetical protein [Burkholderiales bacterium]